MKISLALLLLSLQASAQNSLFVGQKRYICERYIEDKSPCLQNGFLRVKINQDGTFSATEQSIGCTSTTTQIYGKSRKLNFVSPINELIKNKDISNLVNRENTFENEKLKLIVYELLANKNLIREHFPRTYGYLYFNSLNQKAVLVDIDPNKVQGDTPIFGLSEEPLKPRRSAMECIISDQIELPQLGNSIIGS